MFICICKLTTVKYSTDPFWWVNVLTDIKTHNKVYFFNLIRIMLVHYRYKELGNIYFIWLTYGL